MYTDWRFVVHDDLDARKFIEFWFPSYVLAAYLKIRHGMSRADFWRVCVMYVHGGVYADADASQIKLNGLVGLIQNTI